MKTDYKRFHGNDKNFHNYIVRITSYFTIIQCMQHYMCTLQLYVHIVNILFALRTLRTIGILLRSFILNTR